MRDERGSGSRAPRVRSQPTPVIAAALSQHRLGQCRDPAKAPRSAEIRLQPEAVVVRVQRPGGLHATPDVTRGSLHQQTRTPATTRGSRRRRPRPYSAPRAMGSPRRVTGTRFHLRARSSAGTLPDAYCYYLKTLPICCARWARRHTRPLMIVLNESTGP
jgi:hypothetical protein